MSITGIGSSYNNYVYESAYASQKNGAPDKTEAEDSKLENTKDKKVSDYYSYLQRNYDCMSKGNVTISSEYLKKCSSDSAKAKELEEFLKKIPELEKQGYEQLSARNKALGGTVTYYQETWTINRDGSIQATVYSVTETEMTNAERMKKSIEERLEKKKEKEKEEQEQADKLEESGEKISVQEAEGQEFRVRYVEAESELEAQADMQKEKLDDAYYPGFDKKA